MSERQVARDCDYAQLKPGIALALQFVAIHHHKEAHVKLLRLMLLALAPALALSLAGCGDTSSTVDAQAIVDMATPATVDMAQKKD